MVFFGLQISYFLNSPDTENTNVKRQYGPWSFETYILLGETTLILIKRITVKTFIECTNDHEGNIMWRQGWENTSVEFQKGLSDMGAGM